MLFSTKGKVQCQKLERYSQKGTYSLEPENGNLLVDPLLVGFGKGRVRVAAESLVLKLGIKPVDVSFAGRRR